MRKAILRTLTITTAIVAVLGAVAVLPPIRRHLRALRVSADQRLRYARGRARGAQYRLAGMHPNPDVADDILADRVRSQIGPVEKRLDVPRIHVTVFDHVAHLHGTVGTEHERSEIERAVERVSGIDGVESYLHVGLGPGDTRPSEALWHPEPSRQLRQLLNAARGAGAPTTGTWLSVRAVLSTFTDRIPIDERHQLFAHLPADVIGLASAPRRTGATKPRTVLDLVRSVQDISGLTQERALAVTETVVGTLRALVPEEAADVAATLPTDLKELWRTAVPA